MTVPPLARPAVHRARSRGRVETGMTLVEVLVVLAIVAVLAGTVSLSLGALDRSGRELDREAHLLASRLGRVVEDTLLTGRPAAFAWSNGSYQFLSWDGSSWRPHTIALLAGAHDLGRGVSLDEGANRQGSLTVTPDLLAPRLVTLELHDGGGAREIVFDGIAARVTGAGHDGAQSGRRVLR